MKSVNDFVKAWAKTHGGYSPVQNVSQDILKCVETNDYFLTWGQIDVLERALGDLSGDYYCGERLTTKFFSVATFIITCGTANKQK